MAFRLEPNSISHGTLSSREKGKTVLTIEFANGQTLTALLQGNPYRDIAGRILSFRHPSPDSKSPVDDALALQQTGHASDITASLKRVLPHIQTALTLTTDPLSTNLLTLRQKIIDLQQTLRS